MIISQDRLINKYLDAKEYVIKEGYFSEIDWQTQLEFDKLSEKDFLRETAWVILSSGFKEKILRNKFPSITNAFLNWESSSKILSALNTCKYNALKHFKNQRKINAIGEAVRTVSRIGFNKLKSRLKTHGIAYLNSIKIPYIGPITGIHLLKNLGLQFIKPDRHLSRIAKYGGFNSPQEMGEAIRNAMGDSLSEIDIVLWRYSTLRNDYINLFQIA